MSESFPRALTGGQHLFTGTLTWVKVNGTAILFSLNSDGTGALGPSASLGLSWTTGGTVSLTSAAQAAVFNGTSGNGVYTTYSRSGTSLADIGNAAQVFGGGTLDNFGITARAGFGLDLGANGLAAIRVNSSGAVTVVAPASGIGFTATGPSSNWAGEFIGNSGAGSSFGLVVAAGTNASDTAFFVENFATTATFFRIFGNGSGSLGPNNTNALFWGTAGNFSIAAPTAGNALVVNGLANQYTEDVIGSATNGQSYGLLVQAGTTSVDVAFYVRNQTGGTNFMTIYGDGHGFLGPTGSLGWSWTAAGNMTLAAPSSGVALTLSAVSGQDGINLISSLTAPGMRIFSGLGIYVDTTANWAFLMNSAGSNYGAVQNDATNLWSLATGTGLPAGGLGTPCLQWDANTEVGIATPSTIGGLGANLTQAGYMDEPQNLQNANYTLALTDRGKQVYHSSGTAHTWTIPANGSIAFPVGTIIRFINDTGGGNLTINITTDTLVWFPSGTTGSRTLVANGALTIEKVTSTRWVMTGVNIS